MNHVRPVIRTVAWSALALGVVGLGLGVAATVRGDVLAFIYYLCGTGLVAFSGVCAVVLAMDPTRVRASTGKPTAPTAGAYNSHILSFVVGEREKHTVVYSFDQMWGWLTITVDGVLIIKKLVTYTFRLVSKFEFQVGQDEVHTVRIEKHRPLLLSFARPQPIRGFVDGVLVAETDGSRG